MAPTARDEPLRAAPRFTPPTGPERRVWDDPEPEPEPQPGPTAEGPPEPRSRGRSVLLGAGVGLGVGLAAIAVAFSIVAIPLFALASIDPGTGVDRDLVRKGLFFVALPFGGIAGTLCGVGVGIWYGRGGRLPDPPR